MNIEKYNIVAGGVVTLIFAALLMQRYILPLAQNEGSFGHAEVCSENECYERGELVSTGPIGLTESTIFLDTDTQLELTSTQPEDEFTTLRTGRIHAIGIHKVLLPKTEVRIDGSVSVIHYSWMNEAEIIVQDGRADVTIGQISHSLASGDAFRFNYRNETIVSEKSDADLLNSERGAFYQSILIPRD
jgi:hypothetical protein